VRSAFGGERPPDGRPATVSALGVLESIDVDILSKRRLDNLSQ
jgi:hypothetical protein